MDYPEFPSRNRVAERLPLLRIEIRHAEGTTVLNPNEMAIMASEFGLENFAPFKNERSDLSGGLAVIYRSDDLEVRLTPDELQRLGSLSLQPEEFFALANKFGIAHDWHDDFYDFETGEAIQPMEIERPTPPVLH